VDQAVVNELNLLKPGLLAELIKIANVVPLRLQMLERFDEKIAAQKERRGKKGLKGKPRNAAYRGQVKALAKKLSREGGLFEKVPETQLTMVNLMATNYGINLRKVGVEDLKGICPSNQNLYMRSLYETSTVEELIGAFIQRAAFFMAVAVKCSSLTDKNAAPSGKEFKISEKKKSKDQFQDYMEQLNDDGDIIAACFCVDVQPFMLHMCKNIGKDKTGELRRRVILAYGTYYSIAKKCGMKVPEIKSINRIQFTNNNFTFRVYRTVQAELYNELIRPIKRMKTTASGTKGKPFKEAFDPVPQWDIGENWSSSLANVLGEKTSTFVRKSNKGEKPIVSKRKEKREESEPSGEDSPSDEMPALEDPTPSKKEESSLRNKIVQFIATGEGEVDTDDLMKRIRFNFKTTKTKKALYYVVRGALGYKHEYEAYMVEWIKSDPDVFSSVKAAYDLAQQHSMKKEAEAMKAPTPAFDGNTNDGSESGEGMVDIDDIEDLSS
jgi:hypothetical protein